MTFALDITGQIISFLQQIFKTMKKSFIIAAFAALTLTACNNSEKSSTDNNSNSAPSSTAPTINQDSIDKAHGHSHDAPAVNQDSIDKAHGHKH